MAEVNLDIAMSVRDGATAALKAIRSSGVNAEKAMSSLGDAMRTIFQVAPKASKSADDLSGSVDDLGDVAASTDRRMDDLGDSIDHVGDEAVGASRGVDRLHDSLVQASKSGSKFGRAMSGVGGAFKSIGSGAIGVGRSVLGVAGGALKYGATALLGVGAAAGVAGGQMLSMASNMEEGMTKVATLWDTTAGSLQAVRDGLMAVSAQTGQATGTLADGLYDALSSGIASADAFQFMRTAAMGAVAGFTDVSTAVDGLTTALNAWGLGADQATRVMDVFLMGQDKGKFTVGELAGTIGRVAASAAAAGISIEDTVGAISALTNKGLAASEAVSYLNAAVTSVIRQGQGGKLGSMGILAYFDDLRATLGDDQQKLLEFLGSTEALNAVLSLTGQNAGATGSIMSAMAGAGGKTATSFAGVSASKAVPMATNVGGLAATAFGQTMMPGFKDLMMVLGQGFARLLAVIVQNREALVALFRDLASVIIPFVRDMIAAVARFVQWMATNRELIVKAVDDVLAIVYAVIGELWDTIKNALSKFGGTWDGFVENLLKWAAVVVDIVKWMITTIANLLDWLIEHMRTVAADIGAAVGAAIGAAIQAAVDAAKQALGLGGKGKGGKESSGPGGIPGMTGPGGSGMPGMKGGMGMGFGAGLPPELIPGAKMIAEAIKKSGGKTVTTPIARILIKFSKVTALLALIAAILFVILPKIRGARKPGNIGATGTEAKSGAGSDVNPPDDMDAEGNTPSGTYESLLARIQKLRTRRASTPTSSNGGGKLDLVFPQRPTPPMREYLTLARRTPQLAVPQGGALMDMKRNPVVSRSGRVSDGGVVTLRVTSDGLVIDNGNLPPMIRSVIDDIQTSRRTERSFGGAVQYGGVR